MRFKPEFIWDGLLDCDRETLSIFIALFEDGKGLYLVSDKLKDLKVKAKKVYQKALSEDVLLISENDVKDHFSKRILQEELPAQV